MDAHLIANEIASDALKRLNRIRAGKRKWDLPRLQYRYAVQCAVFSAFSAEATLKKFIACRIWLQSRRPERDALRAVWPDRPTVHQMLKFVSSTSRTDPALLGEVGELFKHRNALAHATATMTADEEDDPTHGRVEWRGLTTRLLTEEDIEKAAWCVGVADRLRASLRIDGDPDWKSFQP